MAYSVDVAFTVMAYIGTILFLLPLSLHIKARNTGTILMIFWGTLGLFTAATNSAVYMNTNVNIAPHFCDFASIVGYVYPIGFTAGSLCLLRRLESIASTRQVTQAASDRKKTLIIDLLLGVGIPLLLIPLHFVVQGHRADLLQGFGCAAPLYISIASILLYQIWQTVLSLSCCVYAILVLRWFIIRRKQFTAVLASSNSGLSVNKYLRLMAMVSFELLVWTPIALYVLIEYLVSGELQPYISWDYVHYGFDTVYPFVRADFKPSRLTLVEVGRWSGVLASLVFFAFLGMTPEARTEYKRWFTSVFRMTKAASKGRKTAAAKPDTPAMSLTSSYLPTLSNDDVEKGSIGDAQVFYNLSPLAKDKDGEPSTPDSYYMSGMNYSEGLKVQVERSVA